MIIYDNSDDEDLKLRLRFDNLKDAVTQIVTMLTDVIMGTCSIYLNDNRQTEIMELVTESAMELIKELTKGNDI